MLKYLVLYHSETGNTQQLAREVFSTLQGNSKDLMNLADNKKKPDAKIYFVGFEVYKGTCSMEVIQCLSELHGKQIVLFGTCGIKPASDYHRLIESKVSVWIEDDNQYRGLFLCQGKMPIKVRNKYESLLEKDRCGEIKQMVQNFDEAMLHPDSEDFRKIRKFVEHIIVNNQPLNI